MITKIVKRDGRKVPFNIEKISKAIYKAAVSVGGKDYEEAEEFVDKLFNHILTNNIDIPGVFNSCIKSNVVIISEVHNDKK